MSYASCVAPALERAGLGQPQMQPQMQAQMPMGARTSDRELPSGGAPALRILPSDLAERIAALPQRGDALIDLLEPLIDAELVRPVFERLNRFWRDEQLPALAALADSGLQALDRIAGADDQAASAANRSIEATRRLKQAAASVAFSPPAQPRWWLTTAGKGEASAQLATLVDSVADRGQRAAVASLETVLTGLTQAESAKAGALKSLEQAMERLKAGFEAQRAQLGSLVEPLKSVAIDLEFFCRHFALIVALAGAAAIIWPGEKLRIVRLTARMAEEAGQDISIWRWFEARRRGLLRGRAGPFLLGGGLIAWSLYAAYRLSGLEGAGPALWREAAAGLAILLGAMAWSRYADRPA
jgi:hypothetical protein